MKNHTINDLLKRLRIDSDLEWKDLSEKIQDANIENGRGMEITRNLFRQYAHGKDRYIGDKRVYQLGCILENIGTNKVIAEKIKSMSTYSFLEEINMPYETYKAYRLTLNKLNTEMRRRQDAAAHSIEKSILKLLDHGWLPQDINQLISQIYDRSNLKHHEESREQYTATTALDESDDIPIFGFEDDAQQ